MFIAGGNILNCSVPLILMGHYFLIESYNPFKMTVIINFNGYPICEIRNNRPVSNAITEVSMTPPGIITVSERTTGKFLFKIRPDSETSIVFGKISGKEETITINDKMIKFGSNIIQNNTIANSGIGISIDQYGSFDLGGPLPSFLYNIGPFIWGL